MYGDDDDDGYNYAPVAWIAFTVTTTRDGARAVEGGNCPLGSLKKSLK